MSKVFTLIYDNFEMSVFEIMKVECIGINKKLDQILQGPSMFAVKVKIYGVLYKQSSSIAFDETSSYWLAPKNS